MDEHALVNTLPDGSLERIDAQTVIIDGLFYLQVTLTMIHNGESRIGEGWTLKLSPGMQQWLSEAVHNGIRQE